LAVWFASNSPGSVQISRSTGSTKRSECSWSVLHRRWCIGSAAAAQIRKIIERSPVDIFRETVVLGGKLDLLKMEYQSRVRFAEGRIAIPNGSSWPTAACGDLTLLNRTRPILNVTKETIASSSPAAQYSHGFRPDGSAHNSPSKDLY